jgi:hypothetical protein
MNAPAFDQEKTFLNQDNFKWTLPSEEDLKLQIKQLEGELHYDGISLKRLVAGIAYLTPFWVIILFAAWFALH